MCEPWSIKGRRKSDTREIDTPYGRARLHLQLDAKPRAALILGHGAAGGVAAPDLVAAADAARSDNFAVVLVEQPYRVAGRRSPAPPRQADAVWVAVVDDLASRELRGLPIVVGGRSWGARVACRTADATNAAAVLCLAFPLQPPGDRPSRLPELDRVTVPTLVVQGTRDRFGLPPERAQRTVVAVPGDHNLKADPEAVAAAVRDWLRVVIPPA